MTKLKRIINISPLPEELFVNTLTKEAIKWVKALEQSKPEDEHYQFQNIEDGDCYEVINWIKHFFCLNDEEVK